MDFDDEQVNENAKLYEDFDSTPGIPNPLFELSFSSDWVGSEREVEGEDVQKLLLGFLCPNKMFPGQLVTTLALGCLSIS